MFLLLFAALFVGNADAGTCGVEGFDLTPIQNWKTWVLKTDLDSKPSVFYMNLCNTVQTATSGNQCSISQTSICLKKGQAYTSIGYHNDTIIATPLTEGGGFRLDFRAGDCPDRTREKWQTTINFKCDKTLGSPVFIEQSGCTYFFEWHSMVACKNQPPPAVHEVPCSYYDNSNKKRDLTPLIKQQGGYRVDSDTNEELYINVCRDITPHGPTADCAGSAGCRITNTTNADGTITRVAVDLGQAYQPLQMISQDRTQLLYNTTTKPVGCPSAPQVIIVFICPREGGRNEGSQNPKLIIGTNCNYEVEWVTEFACEAEMLTTTDCAFTNDTHGVDLDLSPLTDTTLQHSYQIDGSEYKYYLDVCQDMTMPCGSNDDGSDAYGAVCQEQVTAGVGGNRVVAGVNNEHLLSYADGELTLTYKGGKVCTHNQFRRTSVISFECDKAAGKGSPTYVTETECTYFFEWKTQYACLDHPVGKSCHLDFGGQHYDLSPLVRQTGSNWQALNGQHESHKPNDEEYFINVCAEILPQGPAALTACSDKSAACFIGHDGIAYSLGQYKEAPAFHNGHITLTYYNGSECNGQARTVITFICAYGDLESAPSIVRKSLNNCLYEFEWRTAAACPLGHKWGTDCRVFDDDAGFSFDLSRLTSASKYTMSHGDYNYSINICAPVTDTPCSAGSNSDAAACQVKKDSDPVSMWAIGRVNTSLEYFDGIVKLTYLHGDRYHAKEGEQGVERKSEIAFLCAPDQDPGAPEFVTEANQTYIFNWYTKYACPEEPIECVVTSEGTIHQQYDLSSLSKSLEEDNWSFVDNSDNQGNRKKYYLNVCRPVNPVKGCGAFTGICQTEFHNNEEVVSISSMGVPKSQPVIESEGHILLTYVNGLACNGGTGRVESRIHFSCRKGVLGSSPRLLEKVNDCLYSFIWETEAACPIDQSNGAGCSIKDPNSQYVFNMQTLSKPPDSSFYEITAPSGSKFQLNICGNVTGAHSLCGTSKGSPPTSCQIYPNGTVEFLGFQPQYWQFSDDGLLKLIYRSDSVISGDYTRTEITFLCRRDVPLSRQKPTFHSKEANAYIFDFETPLACLPESVDCLVSDEEGNQYDLSPLAREAGNWEAVDTRPGKNSSFYINVCRPINSISSPTQFCPGGPIGACQTTGDNKAFNMGYVQAMPEAAADGSLSIRYINGDLCDGKNRRSTRINFECSTTPGSPIFQLKTDSCEYVFTWETPAACPVKRVVGSDCRVKVPNYEFEYDLSSLRSSKDYVVHQDPYEYSINICGPLVSGKGECAGGNVGACQTKPGTDNFVKNAGVVNTNLEYIDGTLKLNYTSGIKNCHSKTYERSTAINFVCDEGVQGKGQPNFINEDSDCTYIFEWATPLACPPFKVIECSYSDNHQQYDLAPLARVDDNYRIDPMATVGNDIYYINVCRSLLHKKGAQGVACPRNAAACLKQGDQYFSLGEVSEGPTMQNGHLVLKYQSGDPCPSVPGENRSSVISLECDKEGVGSTPQYSFNSDNCVYHFIWLTNLACTINEDEEKVTDDCTAVNPATGFKFDLTTLESSKGYTVTSDAGHKYTFSVCAALENSECQDSNVGSCQVETGGANPRSFNSGMYNRKLHYHDGTLFLNYEGGAPCHSNTFTRSTVINFVCSLEERAIGEPVFVDESEDCTYYIAWHTSLACEKFIQCNVINGTEVIDLSPLVSDRGYYLASSMSDDAGQIYINLCRPLNPIPHVRCPAGSAVCLDQSTGQINLGRVNEGPKINSQGRVEIEYSNGDECPEDKNKKISSVIILFCERGTSQGTPSLDHYNDCVYHFSWLTNAVCPPSAHSDGKDCKYFNNVLQYEYDLSFLAADEIQVPGQDGRTYTLHLCNSLTTGGSACQDATVCLQDASDAHFSLGALSTQEFFYEGHILKLKYTDGAQCYGSATKKKQTTIFFKCSESTAPTKPTFFSSDNDCNYIFQWETPLACPPMRMPCDLAYSGMQYDLQPLSQITGSWQFQDDDGNKFFMNLCQPAFNTPDGCPKEASICRQRPDGTVDTLGMVYTQLLNADGDVTEPNLHVTFREGSPKACGAGNGASAESEIILTCSDIVGLPKLTSVSSANDADCKFTFIWESKVACGEERVAVELKDGKLTDPETKSTFDLSPLIKHGLWTAKGDERDEKSGQHVVYTYTINLGTASHPIEGDIGGVCNSALVCQSKENDPFFRNVGERSQSKYYMKDEVLELVTTKPQSCGKEHTKDVTSTILFKCAPSAGLGRPIFNFESSNCQYYFIWETSTLCTQIAPTEESSPSGGSGGHNGGKVNPVSTSKVPAVVGILLGIVVLCVLIIVFHKSERRSAVYYKLRGLFPGAYNKVPSYSYSQLSNGDVEESLLGQGNSRSIYSDDEDEDLLKDNSRGNPIEYRDDSDEEILPTV